MRLAGRLGDHNWTQNDARHLYGMSEELNGATAGRVAATGVGAHKIDSWQIRRGLATVRECLLPLNCARLRSES